MFRGAAQLCALRGRGCRRWSVVLPLPPVALRGLRAQSGGSAKASAHGAGEAAGKYFGVSAEVLGAGGALADVPGACDGLATCSSAHVAVNNFSLAGCVSLEHRADDMVGAAQCLEAVDARRILPGQLRDRLHDLAEVDPLRGGAGGSSATRRRRTERLLEGLHGLLESWSEEDNDENYGDSSEVLFGQLERLIMDRPKDPFAALQRIMREWTGAATGAAPRHDPPHWQDPPRATRWHKRGCKTWDDWSSWPATATEEDYDYRASSSAAQVSWWSGDAANNASVDDGEWQVASGRRRKKGTAHAASPAAAQPAWHDSSAQVARTVHVRPARHELPIRGGTGKGKGAGKGKAHGYKARPNPTAGPVRPSDWRPRPEDWGSGVKLVKTAREALESPDLALLAYPTAAAEFEQLRTFVQSASCERHMTVVLLKGHFEDQRLDFCELDWHEARVPGIWKNQLRVVNAWVGLSSSAAPELARSAVTLQAPASLTYTCVLRVHADWVYFDADKIWDAATASPGPAFRKWAAEAFGRVQDSWGWELQKGPGGHAACIQGLVRLASPLAAAALSKSGSAHLGGRWFLQPLALPHDLHDHGIPDLAIDWVAWHEHETWATYAARCFKEAKNSNLGLARGTKSLGVRRPATGADKARPKERRGRWRASGFPRHWTFEDVEQCLSTSVFGELELHEKIPWRGAAAWIFAATAAADLDFQVLQVQGSEDTEAFEVECAQLSRRIGKRDGQALPFEWKQVHVQGSQRQRRRQADASEAPPASSAVAPPADGLARHGPRDFRSQTPRRW